MIDLNDLPPDQAAALSEALAMLDEITTEDTGYNLHPAVERGLRRLTEQINQGYPNDGERPTTHGSWRGSVEVQFQPLITVTVQADGTCSAMIEMSDCLVGEVNPYTDQHDADTEACQTASAHLDKLLAGPVQLLRSPPYSGPWVGTLYDGSHDFRAAAVLDSIHLVLNSNEGEVPKIEDVAALVAESGRPIDGPEGTSEATG
jgi:hypothetical protein